MLVWPDRPKVEAALRQWAERARARRDDLLGIGYFGSYARGNWGVGSDLDVVLVVAHSAVGVVDRPLGWDVSTLPVPADLLVYTLAEWSALPSDRPGFARRLREETVWVLGPPGGAAAQPRHIS